MLRIDFPDQEDDENLDDISWEEMFGKFKDNNLSFLYQDETGDRDISYFCKFVNKDD